MKKILILIFGLSAYLFCSITPITPRLDKVEKQSIQFEYDIKTNKQELQDQRSKTDFIEKQLKQINIEIEKFNAIKPYILDDLRLSEIKKSVKNLENQIKENQIDKKSFNKDFEKYNLIINRQDKNIDSINFYLIAWGVLITLLLLIMAWRSQVSAAQNADNRIEEWIKDYGDQVLNGKIDDVLKRKEPEINTRINKLTEPITSEVKAILEDIKSIKKTAITHKNEIVNAAQTLKDIEMFNKPTEEEIEKIEEKSISELNAEDLLNLGIENFRKGNYNLALNSTERGLKIDNFDSMTNAKLHLLKAILLEELKKYKEAIGIYNELINRYADNNDIGIQSVVANAIFNKAYNIGIERSKEEGIGIYDELINRYVDNNDIRIQRTVAHAMFGKGYDVSEERSKEEGIRIYDELINRYADNDDIDIQAVVAQSMLNRAHNEEERSKEDAISIYDELINRYIDNDDIRIQKSIVQAMLNKGIIVGAIKSKEEAIGIYDELINRFTDNNDADIQRSVAQAMLAKGFNKEGVSKEEAIGIYDELINHYADNDDIKVQSFIAQALYNKGHNIGKTRTKEDTEGAINIYDDILKRFGENDYIDIQKIVAHTMFSKAHAISEVRSKEEAIGLYDAILKRFGENDDIKDIVENTLINKLELELTYHKQISITTKTLVEKYISQKFSNIIKMLYILECAIDKSCDQEVQEWVEKYHTTPKTDWDFTELEEWSKTFDDGIMKKRLQEYILKFKEVMKS